MSVCRRATVFWASIAAAGVLVANPISAAPTDFTFDVQEIGPQHSHIAIRLRDTSHGNKPVDGAMCTFNPGANDIPQPGLCVTATVGFEAASGKSSYTVLARPGPGTGRYTFIVSPGLIPLALSITAEVAADLPGQTELLEPPPIPLQ
jgi:hypothetical protein